jgi:hypothetical protein
MPRSASRCPNCGEPVSTFAAGCAICGEDLVAARARRAERRASVPGLPARLRDRLPRLDDDALRFGIALLLVLFAPLFGLLLSGFFAWQADRDGRDGVRNVMLALIAVAVVLLLYSPYGLLLT